MLLQNCLAGTLAQLQIYKEFQIKWRLYMYETIKFCVSLKCHGVSVHFHSEGHMLCVGDSIAKLLLSLNVCSTDVDLCESDHHS